MSISVDKLIEEKTLLQKDFDELNKKVKQVEIEVIQMRANMNAINGAIQQTNKLIGIAQEKKKKMKTLKQHIKDKEYDDFEEDLMAEKAPNTADAMKRYKAGKAGFTDKAHLKAKGLIARSDGEKRKSDKYK